MIGSIPIPNTRFYLTSIDGKKWFITEYYRTAPFNPAKETYDLYKAFAEAFRENERENLRSSKKLRKKPTAMAYTPDDIANYGNESRKSTALRNILYIETGFFVDICCNVDTIKTKRR